MSESHPGFVSIDDYLKLPREKGTWLLKPLVPVGGAALLYSPPKAGKSYAAIQIGLALTGQTPDWLGFPTIKTGRVLYIQLDTSRALWAKRFDDLIRKHHLKYDDRLLLADRDTIEHFPFDILQPGHVAYLSSLVKVHDPVAVIVDTLREVHSGDEDSSTISRNVIANLVGATTPAALILISHSRKFNPEADRNLMDDHRGSSYITGRMDAIMRLTPKKLYYTGRSIEEGDVKLERLESGLWAPVQDETSPAVEQVLADKTLTTLTSKAKSLALMIHTSEVAAMSRLRRTLASRGAPSSPPPGKVIDFHL